MEIVILVVVLVALVGGTAAFVTAARRRGGVELEPPPARPAAPPARPPARPPASVEEAPVVEPEALPEEVVEPEAPEVPTELVEEIEEALAPPVKPRLRDRLGKARSLLAGYVGSVLSRDRVDAETWDEIEEALLRADVGVSTTTALIETLRMRVDAEGITEPAALVAVLKDELKGQLSKADRSLALDGQEGVAVWLIVGVNGVGKTTTIGKVARQHRDEGHRVVMAAGDTFRAAAGEQLETWAERAEAELVRGADGADPASVIYDAIERAAARGADLVLADTAGRLHTKVNLMEELRKIRRVADKPPGHVTEVLLVLDATTGQNGLVQAHQFTDAVDVTGVVLTKLDGSAKGGIVLAIQSDLGIPVKLVGVGEGVEDLVQFDPDEFVEALFS